jgi:hypothetical protein
MREEHRLRVFENMLVRKLFPHKTKKKQWSESASELYRLSDRRLSV